MSGEELVQTSTLTDPGGERKVSDPTDTVEAELVEQATRKHRPTLAQLMQLGKDRGLIKPVEDYAFPAKS